MATPTEPPPSSLARGEFPGESFVTDFHVEGTLPAGLSGRLIGIGPCIATAAGTDPESVGANDGMVHSVHLDDGCAISYRSRWVITDAVARRLGIDASPGPRNAGPDTVAGHIVAFGGLILALGNGSLAYELSADLDTLRRVDLAGKSRGLVALAKRATVGGDLHLVAVTDDGVQAHVVVSSGGMTRTSRTLENVSELVTDVAVTLDRIVLATNGRLGVVPRSGETHVTWIPTGVEAPLLVEAHDVGDAVVVHVVTPSLERWTLYVASAIMRRDVLDSTPRLFAATNDPTRGAPNFLWTTGEHSAHKHDLAQRSHIGRNFHQAYPGDLVFVRDPSRPADADGGWLVGFVHTQTSNGTNLVVLDAANLTVLASIGIPRHVPYGVHSTWIPSTSDNPTKDHLETEN